MIDSEGNNGKRGGKRAQLTSVADVLQGLLQNSKSGLSEGFLRWRLEQQWTQVVGESLAQQTVPCHLENGVLHIWVKHSAWLQQLWFFKDMIRDKVNSHTGQASLVRQVRFTLNRRAVQKESKGSGG